MGALSGGGNIFGGSRLRGIVPPPPTIPSQVDTSPPNLIDAMISGGREGGAQLPTPPSLPGGYTGGGGAQSDSLIQDMVNDRNKLPVVAQDKLPMPAPMPTPVNPTPPPIKFPTPAPIVNQTAPLITPPATAPLAEKAEKPVVQDTGVVKPVARGGRRGVSRKSPVPTPYRPMSMF